MKNKRYFPMFIDLSDKKIVVVGGGNIATRRIRTLLQFTRNITAIAPKSTMELQELGKTGYVNLITRPVKRSDFDMAYMVIAATNDWKLNDEIYRVCKEEGIYVNVADDKSKCDFYFPGIYMKDEVVIGITASGLDHSRAKKSAWQFRKQWRHQMIQTTAKNKVIIGSRESRLAVLQSEMVRDYIKEQHPGLDVEILTMKTTGDKILDRTLDKVGGKGLFVKELDKALLEGRTMLSVHSLKDMPMEVPEDLPLLAFSRREDPRDVLVLPEGVASLDPLKPLGCSSLRRTLQLQTIYPDMKVKSIRGNLQTRLRKLDAGEYAGLILAAAGLKRLGLEKRIHRYFSVDEILPAAGQGILAVQGHKGLKYEYLSGYKDEDAWIAGTAERAFVRYLDGGCSSPVAAFGIVEGEELFLRGLYYREKDGRYFKDSIRGPKTEAARLGMCLAEQMKREHEEQENDKYTGGEPV